MSPRNQRHSVASALSPAPGLVVVIRNPSLQIVANLVFFADGLAPADHLSDQADGDELDADDQEQDAAEEEGTVAQRCAQERLFDHQPEEDYCSRARAYQAPEAEQVQRAAEISGCEKDREEIEKTLPESGQAELGFPVSAGPVLDGEFADPESIPLGKYGEEAVEFSVDVEVLDDIAPVGFQAAVEVVDFDSCQQADDEIEQAGRDGFG